MGSSSQELSPSAGAAQGTSSLAPRESAKHTAGPWESVSDSHYVAPVGVVTPLVALVFHSEQREANARLIAAAPELLAAAEELMASFVPFKREVGKSPMEQAIAHGDRHAAAKVAMRAAIRKALSDGSEARTGGEEG